jgi:uncharacterized protein (DUF885 family)
MRAAIHLAAAFAAALLAACAPGPSASAPTPGDAPARVTAVADHYLAGLFDFFPEYPTFFGAANVRHDRLRDPSPARLARWQSHEDAWLDSLRAIDPAVLDGTAAAVTYAVLREALEASREARVCRDELWQVDQLSGWQVFLPQLGQLQPLGSDERRRDALARWRQIPRLGDQTIANLREGLRLGYTAPRSSVDAVLGELDGLLALPAERSPFALLGARDSAPGFRDSVVAIVREQVYPVLQRYRDFLARDYLRAARTEPGVSANPNGAACYRARLRSYTTLPLDPKAVHELGLRQMDRIEGEMRTIAQRSVQTADVPGLLQRLRTDPRYTFRSREEVIGTAEQAFRRAQAAMPRWFGRLPKAQMIVDPCQPFEEKSGCPGSYSPPSEDGSRPGRYRINAGNPTSIPRASAEATAFHEGIPGHHLQVALALERQGVHPISRFIFNSGFAEGWALYAERLADEMGLYSGDLDRMGLLSNDALRAARLVVDAGVHALGWSRQQAIDYMLAHTAESREVVVSEVDRYIIDPGQATAYMVGRLEIERLRRLAEARLGRRFDVRAFHDRVLENGSVPLAWLGREIDRWSSGK